MKHKPQLPIGLLDKPAKKGKYAKKLELEDEELDECLSDHCGPQGVTLKISLLLPSSMQYKEKD